MPQHNDEKLFDDIVADEKAPPKLGRSNLRQKQRALDREGEERGTLPFEAPEAPERAVVNRSAPEPARDTVERDRASESRSEPQVQLADPRGETVRLTVYVYPDQKKALKMRAAVQDKDMSMQIRTLLDRTGLCDDEWAG